jgi:hypothetical protein
MTLGQRCHSWSGAVITSINGVAPAVLGVNHLRWHLEVTRSRPSAQRTNPSGPPPLCVA